IGRGDQSVAVRVARERGAERVDAHELQRDVAVAALQFVEGTDEKSLRLRQRRTLVHDGQPLFSRRRLVFPAELRDASAGRSCDDTQRESHVFARPKLSIAPCHVPVRIEPLRVFAQYRDIQIRYQWIELWPGVYRAHVGEQLEVAADEAVGMTAIRIVLRI